MEKENAAKQSLEQLHERRKQVVRLHKRGIKIMKVAEMTGLSYPAVRAVIDLFDAGGWTATRHKLSMIATVTNQGKTRWMIIDEAFDADKFIEF